MLLAMTGNRNVDAFDDLVYYEAKEKIGVDYYSTGNLWLAPVGGGVYNISEGSWYHAYRPFRRR